MLRLQSPQHSLKGLFSPGPSNCVEVVVIVVVIVIVFNDLVVVIVIINVMVFIVAKKQFYKNVIVVLCKKPLEKTTKYSKNETILKIGYLAKAIAHAKARAFAKWSVWVKT